MSKTMLGDKYEPVPKEKQLRRISLGDVWMTTEDRDRLAEHAIWYKPERGKMTKNGAVTDYLWDVIRLAMKEPIKL